MLGSALEKFLIVNPFVPANGTTFVSSAALADVTLAATTQTDVNTLGVSSFLCTSVGLIPFDKIN